MSFEEKSTWITALSLGIVNGWYFARILAEVSRGEADAIVYQGSLLVTLAISVVLIVVGHVVVAIANPKAADQTDERDRDIERRGEYFGGYVLGSASLLVLGLAMVEVDHFWIAHAILAGLILSELVSAVTKIVAYRRGF